MPGPSEGTPRAGALPPGGTDGTASVGAPPQDGTGEDDTGSRSDDRWRSRFVAAAQRRGIPITTIVATVLVVIVVLDLNALAVLLLWVLRRVILFAVVAGFLTLLLSPPVRMLERRGLSRGAASVVVFLAAVLAFGGLVYLFSAPVITGVTRLLRDLPTLVKQAEHGRGSIGRLITTLHLQQWVNTNAPKLASDITKSLKPAQALSVGAAAFSTVISLTTIAVLCFFTLLEAPRLGRGLLGLLSPDRADRVSRVSREVARSVSGYMFGNALTSLIAGVVVLVTLLVLGVPFPLLLGVWVALVDLLPLVGGLLAGVPVVIVALLHSPVAGLVTLIVFLVYQQIENHVLNPVIMGKTVRLSPLWVLIAVLVGATLGGRIGSGLGSFVGALVGIPAGGALQVVVREIRRGPEVPGAVVPANGGGAPGGPAGDGAGDGAGGTTGGGAQDLGATGPWGFSAWWRGVLRRPMSRRGRP